MAFEGLTQRLAGTFKKLKNRGKLSESDVKEAMREVRLRPHKSFLYPTTLLRPTK